MPPAPRDPVPAVEPVLHSPWLHRAVRGPGFTGTVRRLYLVDGVHVAVVTGPTGIHRAALHLLDPDAGGCAPGGQEPRLLPAAALAAAAAALHFALVEQLRTGDRVLLTGHQALATVVDADLHAAYSTRRISIRVRLDDAFLHQHPELRRHYPDALAEVATARLEPALGLL